MEFEAPKFDYSSTQPEYKKVYGYWSNLDELKVVLAKNPLDKDAIDWIAEQGYFVVYLHNPKAFKGVTIWPLRKIEVEATQSDEKQDVILMHELLHTIVPGLGLLDKNSNGHVAVFDEAVRSYMQNTDLLAYAKLKLPSYCRNNRQRPVFPDWPISGDITDWVTHPPQLKPAPEP